MLLQRTHKTPTAILTCKEKKTKTNQALYYQKSASITKTRMTRKLKVLSGRDETK